MVNHLFDEKRNATACGRYHGTLAEIISAPAGLVSCPDCEDTLPVTADPYPRRESEEGGIKRAEKAYVNALKEVRTTSSTGGQKGTKLARHDLIPSGPLTALAEHYGRGALKYANHQWRAGYEFSKSYSALQRHAVAWNGGQSYDVCSNDPEGCSFVTSVGSPFEAPEPDTCYNHTGSHHMAAVAWHAFCLLEFEAQHPGHDDRFVNPSNGS